MSAHIWETGFAKCTPSTMKITYPKCTLVKSYTHMGAGETADISSTALLCCIFILHVRLSFLYVKHMYGIHCPVSSV